MWHGCWCQMGLSEGLLVFLGTTISQVYRNYLKRRKCALILICEVENDASSDDFCPIWCYSVVISNQGYVYA